MLLNETAPHGRRKLCTLWSAEPLVSITAVLCDSDVNSRQDEEHNAELSTRLWFVRGQEDDAVREHCA